MSATATTAKPRATSAKSAARTRAAAAKPDKKVKKARKTGGKEEAKVKVVRDSFTMPQSDYAKIGELKQACQKAGLQVKKSELLRAGLHALGKLSMPQMKQILSQMEHIKTGRPKKA